MGKGIFGLINNLRQNESGNIFFTMFGAVALVGAIGAASMTVMKGPVRSMSEVTKRTIAENNMMASSKLAVVSATAGADSGDCDSDGMIEPTMFETPTTMAAPTGGGHLPASIGASLQDPWQNRYGYCVWDHGSTTMDASCEVSGANNRLPGFDQQNQVSLVVISAGPDRAFQTSCISALAADTAGNSNGMIDGDEQILIRVSGSDDVVHSFTYAEANTAGGGLWNLKAGDQDTAQIGKDLEIRNDADDVTFALDRDTGIGSFMAIKVDSITTYTSDHVAMDAPLRFTPVPGAPPEGGSAGGGGGGGGGSDDLGNHTALQDLDMASFNIIGAGTVTASAYLHSSDRNLKDQITDIDDPFALLAAIHGKHYVWKKDGTPAYGVIAQDVELVMPEAVSTDANGMKAVEYDQLIAPLIEAVKQLRDENESLRKEIDALKDAR